MTGEKRYLPSSLPLPEVSEQTRAFLTTGRLELQTCRACGSAQHPPGELCFSCGGFTFDYVVAEPVGTISSWTVVHHVTHPSLRDAVPYNVVIVELDGHPHVRIVGNLVDGDRGDLSIGRRVRGEWTEPLESEEQEPVQLHQWHVHRSVQ